MKNVFYLIIPLVFVFVLSACGKNANMYIVSFETNIDIKIDDIVLSEGSVLKLSDLPVKDVDGHEFYGWYVDSNFQEEFIETIISTNLVIYGKYVEYSAIPEVKALNTLKVVNKTYVDITLSEWALGYDVIWESSNENAISNSGKYMFVSEDTEVTLKASIASGDKVFTKEFKILVQIFPYETLFNTAIQAIKFESLITKDITLRTSFGNGIIGEWSSSDENVISNSGVVTRGDIEKIVTLTLKLKLNDKEKTSTFELTVSKKDPDMSNPQYFIDSLSSNDLDVNKTIMNIDEIKSYNQIVLNSSGTNVVDLTILDQTVTGTYVNGRITNYSSISKYKIYNNGVVITSAQQQAILDNRNLSAIPSSVNVKYAVSTNHTSLRSYPTEFYSETSAIDRFQETGFSTGIPMIVYHQSLDKNWYYVRMYNYDGWVKASDIALCSRDEFLKFCKPENFIVVLTNLLKVEEQYIRMGYKLPYKSKTETTYILEFPTRNIEGNLILKDVVLNKSDEISDGFIPYNYTNLLQQGFKLLNMKYSWGDKIYDGLDCSSTMAAIYSCFGFVIGRNTSNQWKTNIYGKSFSSFSESEMKKYQVGTLIFTSSHVMMYIGTDANGNCWLLHNTTSGNICKLQTLKDYGTGSIRYTLVFHN